MEATETLKHEHQVILLVLQAVEREVQGMRESNRVEAERVAKMVDFAQSFADRCHHAKEENLLFAKMEERGMSAETGPIAEMLAEHAAGRRLVRAVADALPRAVGGQPGAVAVVRDSLSAYTQLLRSHIEKEDNILYPMAERLLTPEDQRALVEAFERVEAEEMGAGVHERYHRLAHQLAGGGV